jgi:hypothetical protein
MGELATNGGTPPSCSSLLRDGPNHGGVHSRETPHHRGVHLDLHLLPWRRGKKVGRCSAEGRKWMGMGRRCREGGRGNDGRRSVVKEKGEQHV